MSYRPNQAVLDPWKNLLFAPFTHIIQASPLDLTAWRVLFVFEHGHIQILLAQAFTDFWLPLSVEYCTLATITAEISQLPVERNVVVTVFVVRHVTEFVFALVP